MHLLPAGSVPLNHVRIASMNGARVLLISRGTAGRRCVLHRSTNLTSWAPIGSALIAPDGTAQLRDTSPPAAGAFYRVLEE